MRQRDFDELLKQINSNGIQDKLKRFENSKQYE